MASDTQVGFWGTGLNAYGLVMDSVIRPVYVGIPLSFTSIVVEVVAIAASLMMFKYARCAQHGQEQKVNAGLLYFVINAALVAIINVKTGLAAVNGSRL